MQDITFVTGNSAKAEQISRHLDIPISHQKLELEEVQSLDLHEIVERKAKEAYAQVKSTVLVEDVSLTFHALGKLPGPFIKWFLAELGNVGLCKLLDGYTDRTALAQVCFGLFDGKELHIFDGQRMGSIAPNPRSEDAEGFGWNSIFIPEGCSKTWAEMDIEEQKETSMRRIALKKLEKFLQD